MNTLAVDLGGTHMRCAAVDDDGVVADRLERDTPHDGTGIDALVDLMRSVAGSQPCTSAVIGVPGRVDYAAGTLDEAAHLPQSWIAHLTSKELGEAIGLPVSLANDADLAAVGEAFFGAGRSYRDVAYITISTGIGAGVVLNGSLVRARKSLAEVGHTIIDLSRDRASLEALASGTAMGDAAEAAGLGRKGQDVLDAIAAGNVEAKRIWAGVVDAASAGVVNLAWTFTPEVIVIGGGLGLVGDALLAPLREALHTGPPALDITLTAAGLGDDAGLTGAAAWGRATA